MYPLDPLKTSENLTLCVLIRGCEMLGFLMFSGGSKESIRKKRVKVSFPAVISNHINLFVVIFNITETFFLEYFPR